MSKQNGIQVFTTQIRINVSAIDILNIFSFYLAPKEHGIKCSLANSRGGLQLLSNYPVGCLTNSIFRPSDTVCLDHQIGISRETMMGISSFICLKRLGRTTSKGRNLLWRNKGKREWFSFWVEESKSAIKVNISSLGIAIGTAEASHGSNKVALLKVKNSRNVCPRIRWIISKSDIPSSPIRCLTKRRWQNTYNKSIGARIR